MNRREFVSLSAASGAGLLILPSGTLLGQNAPSNKLNVLLVGVGGRGTAHFEALSHENVVAICDVNDNCLSAGLELFPKAKAYWDWRKALDQKDIEAVIICTADHHHAFIANWALNRGLHVFCEKPLGIGVEEVRTVRANYIKQKAKVVTCHGTQRHSWPNFERVRELIMDGAIGELKTVSGWDSRAAPRPGYPKGESEPPRFFHYDQWIGPSPFHPYSPQYFSGGCMSWNEYRDFGVGQMGDMGAHTMDLLWNAIDAGAPTAIEPDLEVSDKYNPDINPVKLKVTFDHPKNAWRGPIQVVWYQGGLKPSSPRTNIDLTRVGNGAVFEGTKGIIIADFTSRMILPNNDDGDMTYYKRRSKEQLVALVNGTGQSSSGGAGAGAGSWPVTQLGAANPARPGRGPAGPQAAQGGPGGRGQGPAGPQAAQGGSGARGQLTPDGFPMITLTPDGLPRDLVRPTTASNEAYNVVFQTEWINACKGMPISAVHGTSSKTHCDFDYAGTMMEQMILGLVAHRAGKRLEYDPVSGRVTNMLEANDWLKRTYRQGWTLNG